MPCPLLSTSMRIYLSRSQLRPLRPRDAGTAASPATVSSHSKTLATLDATKLPYPEMGCRPALGVLRCAETPRAHARSLSAQVAQERARRSNPRLRIVLDVLAIPDTPLAMLPNTWLRSPGSRGAWRTKLSRARSRNDMRGASCARSTFAPAGVTHQRLTISGSFGLWRRGGLWPRPQPRLRPSSAASATRSNTTEAPLSRNCVAPPVPLRRTPFWRRSPAPRERPMGMSMASGRGNSRRTVKGAAPCPRQLLG